MGPDLRVTLPAAISWVAVVLGLGAPVPLLLVLATIATGGGIAALVVDYRHLAAPRRRLGTGRRVTRRRAAAAGCLLCVAAALASTAVRVHGRTTGPLAVAARARSYVTVELVVTGDPVLHGGRVTGANLGQDLVVLRARTVRLTAAGRTWRVAQPIVVLAGDPGWLHLAPSQRLTATGRLDLPRPGDPVAAALSARGPPTGVGATSLVQRAAGSLRSGLRTASAAVPGPAGGLLPGLVDGDTSGLPPVVADDFKATGLTHLVAVSGTNVAIVLGVCLALAKRAGAGPRSRAVIGGLALAGFVVVARPSPSVLRAAAMGAVVLLALALGRRASAQPALSTGVLGLLLVDPDLARSVGFALSVLATAGLLLLAPIWRERLARRWPGWLADLVAVPLAAQVACTPVLAAAFGQVSLVSVPANLFAAPAVAPATLAGVLAAVVAPVYLPVARLAARVGGFACWWLVEVAQFFAQAPAAVLHVPHGLLGAGVVLAVIPVGARLLRGRVSSRFVGSGMAAAYTASLLVVPAIIASWPPPDWRFAACDVGQGDALVVRGDAAHGDLLIDTGPDPELVHRCLVALGVHRIGLLVLTHLHADHVEGLPGVLGRFPVNEVEIGPLLEPPTEWQRVQRWVGAAHVPLTTAVLGERRSLGPVSWRVIGPVAVFHGTDSDPNNASLVMRMALPGFTALLTGDVEGVAQQAVLHTGEPLQVDLLKIPHHGSEKQDPAFLSAVRPRLSIASVGVGNPYGHPSARTLDLLAAGGSAVLRTDAFGSVAVVVRNGRLATVVSRTGARPPPGPIRAAALAAPGFWCS